MNRDLSIGLVTLNAKFIHTSIGIRYLRNAARTAGFSGVWIQEFIINQPLWKIAAEIQKRKPDVLGVSIYIWNRVQSFELIERLKKQNPNLSIVVGGPEVSFESSAKDYTVIAGEGEKRWVEFLNFLQLEEPPPEGTLKRWEEYGGDLPDLLVPYLDEDFPQIKNRIAYLETSRGCPYLCSFCISALDKSVRYFDESAINGQIESLMSAGVRQIKFVDRTFNLKPKRMKRLMRELSPYRGASFHFEVVGDLLTPDMMDFLETVPAGMFQFEIGIQTTAESALEAIQRKQYKEKLFENIRRLVWQNRIHLHCDLIFGLPGETLCQILKSFNEVFALKPHELQLGFLKFLPGAPIRSEIESYHYQFQSTPPYEVIANQDLPAENIIYLKKFTEVFDLFSNSKRFRFSIDYLRKTLGPAQLFNKLVIYMDQKDLFLVSHSLDRQYEIFAETFSLQSDPLARDLLKLDYLYAQRSFRLPAFLRSGSLESPEPRYKAWQGDRTTPLIPFRHEILLTDSGVELRPSATLLYYAIAHPTKDNGYIQTPSIVKVDS